MTAVAVPPAGVIGRTVAQRQLVCSASSSTVAALARYRGSAKPPSILVASATTASRIAAPWLTSTAVPCRCAERIAATSAR
jgi:hypothetical protein